MPINVLLVAAGRRVTMGSLFKQHGCEVFAYELESEVPIAEVAIVLVGKKWNDSDFPADLAKVIKKHDIKLVIPFDCAGVHAVSKLKLDTNIICSPEASAEKCLDKIKFQQFMLDNFPQYYPKPKYGKPYIIKPKFGFGSVGVRSGKSYHSGLENPDEVVVQHKLPGFEYSVDAYFNKEFKMVGASPRQRLWVSGGEVIESMTVDFPELNKITKEIGEKLELRGPICLQYLLDKNEKPKLIEINARAGGGSTIGIKAGLDLIQNIIDEYILGKILEPDSQKAEPNIYCSRSFRDHFFKVT